MSEAMPFPVQQESTKIGHHMNREIAMTNVGVNKDHWRRYHLVSPLFEDGDYAYVPIPEEGYDAYPQCPLLPSYRELFRDNPRVLAIIREAYQGTRVHNDPEFKTYTYGDNPYLREGRGRAGILTQLREGDLLFFFGRLTRIRGGSLTNEAGLFFFGFFEIQEIEPEVVSSSSKLLQVYGNNAHVKRGIANPKYFNRFLVCKGSENSLYFTAPVPFNQEVTTRIVKFDRHGRKFVWSEENGRFRIQQGGRTRSCRFVNGGDEAKKVLLRHVLRFNEVPLFRQLLA